MLAGVFFFFLPKFCRKLFVHGTLVQVVNFAPQ